MHKLYTIEGLDGSGKSSIADKLIWNHPEFKLFHEPWGPIGDFIRNQSADFDKVAKMLLFASARREFVQNKLIPTLKNHDVILDRFTASTIAYQVYGDGTDYAEVQRLLDLSVEGLQPIDATIYIDISAETRKARLNNRDKHDSLDDYRDDYYQRVGENYLKSIELTNPNKIYTIDGNQSLTGVYHAVEDALGLSTQQL